jgi:hypothetical protein
VKAGVLPILVLSGALAGSLTRAQTDQSSSLDSKGRHVRWVVESLKRMQALKSGMTRADLLRVFTTEGGLSTGLRRTYVYRGCPYFKVDVEFEAVGRPASDGEGRVTLVESDADRIKTISRPYLQFSVAD